MSDEAKTSLDLSSATTLELVQELENRSDAVVFAALLKCDQRSKERATATLWFSGGLYTALGLLEQLRHDIVTRSGSLAQLSKPS